jgi:hypothetical protein
MGADRANAHQQSSLLPLPSHPRSHCLSTRHCCHRLLSPFLHHRSVNVHSFLAVASRSARFSHYHIQKTLLEGTSKQPAVPPLQHQHNHRPCTHLPSSQRLSPSQPRFLTPIATSTTAAPLRLFHALLVEARATTGNAAATAASPALLATAALNGAIVARAIPIAALAVNLSLAHAAATPPALRLLLATAPLALP